MKKNYTQALHHFLIIVGFAIISFIYLYPVVEGKVLFQMDFVHAKGIAHEANTYHNLEHRDIAWTNSLFGGMPTYFIGGISKPNIFKYFLRLINHTILPYATVSSLFLYFLGFYILLLVFKVDKWLSAIGALGFGLASYNIIIIAVGHVTKTYAIGLMPIVLSGFILIYERKWLIGALTAMLGLGMQITTSHIQILYYSVLLVGLYVLFRLYWDFKNKELKNFFLSSLVALTVIILAILPNITTFWQSWEMSKYSIRGKSELTKNQNSNGLDKDYALAWSLSPGETFATFIPNFKGGASEPIGNNPTALKNVDPQYRQIISQQNQYWGEQPFTSGPVYFGAIIVFLALLGMIIIKDKIKWFLLTATIFSLILSWGKFAGFITDILFNYFPFYNKFRTVSMISVIANITVPLLAILAIKELIENRETYKKNKTPILTALGIMSGLIILLLLFAPNSNLISSQEQQQLNSLIQQSPSQKPQIQAFIDQLIIARKSILKADILRTLLYVLLSGGTILLYLMQKNENKKLLLSLLAVLIVFDMWTVDRRYLNKDNFKNKTQVKNEFQKSNADKFILKDKDMYFRVLNLTRNVFNDAITPYYHKSIGGYHAAKLRRYQDIIEHYLSYEISAIANSLQDTTTNITQTLPKLKLINMLNTKYIIISPNTIPIINTNAYGNAWFTDNFKFVETADDEIKSIATINPLRTAIINKKKFDISKLPTLNINNQDSLRTIKLTVYKPDIQTYTENSQNGGFIVFSDIYYPEGWIATIDGKPTKIYQVDYILRGIYVPAGKHEIKFEFKPAAVFTANKIALIGSIIVGIILLLIVAKLFLNYKKQQKN